MVCMKHSKQGLGTHLMCDMYQIQNILNPKTLEDIINRSVDECGATLIKNIGPFCSEGKILSGAIVAESHILVNLYPSERYAFVDIFLCGSKDPYTALIPLQERLNPQTIKYYEVRRGLHSKETHSRFQNKDYGLELILDLGGCNKKTITSAKKLKEFVYRLCDLIDMKRYGDTIIEGFGFGEEHITGYSIAQLIETSLISGHFSESRNTAHLNIFSCKKFNTAKAAMFCKAFFGANLMKYDVLSRSDLGMYPTE